MNLTKAIAIARALGGSSGSGGGGSGGGGGGVVAVSPKEVNFFDYDGTCVYAYSVAEAQALSALPAGPEHPGLVFQGWNWSLEGVKGLTRAMNIGAMYTTDDGTTRLYITLQEGRTSPMLGVGVNGTVTVDWGDGTEPDVLTGTNVGTTKWTPNHAYAAPGDYVIRLTVDGEMAFSGNVSSDQYAYILRHASNTDARNHVYQNSLQRVAIGDGVTSIKESAFYGCYSLASLTIPDGVTSINDYAFYGCYSLTSLAIPDGVTSIGRYAFKYCYSLASLAIPDDVTRIESETFYNCCSLASLTIPDGVTVIGSKTFYNCYSLASLTIPDGVTVIGSNAFAFCSALASVVIPDGVTVIESKTFYGCYGMAYYDFTQHSSIPSLANTDAFASIPADCEIRVPTALYDEWIAATNWATYADHIKAY